MKSQAVTTFDCRKHGLVILGKRRNDLTNCLTCQTQEAVETNQTNRPKAPAPPPTLPTRKVSSA